MSSNHVMVGLFLALSGLSALLVLLMRKRGQIFFFALTFFVYQLLLCAYAIFFRTVDAFWSFFAVDRLSLAMFAVVSVIGVIASVASYYNIDGETIKKQKIYYLSLILLDLMLLGVIFSDNIVINWIFLEGTTLAVAAISFHHRNFSAVEATWKYIFVSSVGIVIAYMGILLLGNESSSLGTGLSYADLRSVSSHISPLILKISFLLIFVGYSVKLETIPLYTPAIDLNHASPSPSAAFISSALVGSSMLSLLRLYGVVASNAEVFAWVRHLLLIVGILSIVISAVYMGRTSNCKRLLSYSTVENNGIALVGLALGGVGVFAAILHTLAHMVVKSVLFFQIGTVGKIYGTLTLGRHNGYLKADPVGAVVIILSLFAISAFPPSVLFTSEITIFTSMLSGNLWWVLIIAMVALLIALYWLIERMLLLVLRANSRSLPRPDCSKKTTGFSVLLLFILFVFFVIGWVMPEQIVSYVESIANSIVNG